MNVQQENDPSSWSETVWYLAVGASLAGGFIRCYAKALGRKMSISLVIQLVFELIVSVIVGMAVFMLMMSLDYREGICAFSACVTASMSAKLLTAIQTKIKNRIERIL